MRGRSSFILLLALLALPGAQARSSVQSHEINEARTKWLETRGKIHNLRGGLRFLFSRPAIEHEPDRIERINTELRALSETSVREASELLALQDSIAKLDPSSHGITFESYETEKRKFEKLDQTMRLLSDLLGKVHPESDPGAFDAIFREKGLDPPPQASVPLDQVIERVAQKLNTRAEYRPVERDTNVYNNLIAHFRSFSTNYNEISLSDEDVSNANRIGPDFRHEIRHAHTRQLLRSRRTHAFYGVALPKDKKPLPYETTYVDLMSFDEVLAWKTGFISRLAIVRTAYGEPISYYRKIEALRKAQSEGDGFADRLTTSRRMQRDALEALASGTFEFFEPDATELKVHGEPALTYAKMHLVSIDGTPYTLEIPLVESQGQQDPNNPAYLARQLERWGAGIAHNTAFLEKTRKSMDAMRTQLYHTRD
jgi:hypothetical protein